MCLVAVMQEIAAELRSVSPPAGHPLDEDCLAAGGTAVAAEVAAAGCTVNKVVRAAHHGYHSADMSYYALASDVVHRIETSAEAAVAAGTADVAANADVEAAAAVAADDESADQHSVEGTTADGDVAAVAKCSCTYFAAAASECEDLHTAYDLHTHCADLGRNFHVSAAVAYAVMVGCVSSRETACKLEQVVEVSIDHRTP